MKLPQLKTLQNITFALILLLYAFLITYKIELPVRDDMARHVKNGELIMHGHFEVLYSNVYSYTMPDQRFINHHWLSGVIFYLLKDVIGWGGLVVFKVITLLAAFVLLFRTAMRKANFWLVAFFSIPTIYILLDRSTLRPEIFSYLFIALFLYCLTSGEEGANQKKIFWLVPLQLLWVNMHIFFIVGPALVAGFLFEKIIQQILDRNKNKKSKASPLTPLQRRGEEIKRLFFLLIALIAVCFLNPNGVAGVLYPFHIFTDYGMPVLENQSLISCLRTYTLQENLSKIVFCLSAVLLFISFFFNGLANGRSEKERGEKGKRLPVFYFLAAVATTVAGIMVIRFNSFFGMIFLPAITYNLNGAFGRMKIAIEKIPLNTAKLKQAAAAVFVLLLIVFMFFETKDRILNSSDRGIGLTARSEDAAAFFKQNKLKGPIFNDYDIGSYLIYNFYPAEKVFVDNRPEAFSASFFQNVSIPICNDENLWHKMEEKYHFNCIFLYEYDLGTGVRDFMFRRMKDSTWALVYADMYSIIFLKNNNDNYGIIQKYKITPDNVAQRVDYMLKSDDFDERVSAGDIFNMVGRTDLGMGTFFKLVSKWPQSGKIWKVMGEWELANTDNPKSPLLVIMYLEKAISTGYKTAEVYSQLANAYKKIGFDEEAEKAVRKALKINPDWPDAKYQMEQIEREKKGVK